MKKLLITGASGFIGRHLCQMASSQWQVVGLFNSHPTSMSNALFFKIDLTNLSNVTRLFKEVVPDAVIHTAAASSLGRCQTHPEETYAINVAASEHIARLCKEAHVPCVFTSTDIVFDGVCPPYRETDPVSPINVYGKQKAAAEHVMMATYERVVVCRLSLIFGMAASVDSFFRPDGPILSEGKPMHLFEDEFRTPLRVERSAAGLCMALNQPGGVIHLAGKERISRYEFGLKIARAFQFSKAHIVPARQGDIDLGAPRPPDVSLDISKAMGMGFSPPSLDEELADLARHTRGR